MLASSQHPIGYAVTAECRKDLMLDSNSSLAASKIT